MPLNAGFRNAVPSRDVSDQVRLAGSPLCPRAHICAFFSNADDEYKALLPFIKEGIDSGERAIRQSLHYRESSWPSLGSTE